MEYVQVTVYTNTAGIEPLTLALSNIGINGCAIEDAADFDEFLNAAEPSLYKYLEETNPEEILKIQHEKLIEQYRNYLIVGGMPDCVYSWITEKNSGLVLQIQNDLIARERSY